VSDGRSLLPTPVLIAVGGAIGGAVGSSGGRNATGFVAGLIIGAALGWGVSLIRGRKPD
jgi:predicted MFS family arabinose efflux permease